MMFKLVLIAAITLGELFYTLISRRFDNLKICCTVPANAYTLAGSQSVSALGGNSSVRKSRSTDWNAELKGAALGYIKDSVLPESAKMLFALVEPILFGIPKKDNKFEKIHRLLENLDNTLKTVKDAIDYQNTFKKDDDYDQQLDELEAVYKRYEHDNHNVINQRKLDAKCNDVQTDSILVFYDKQLNTKNDRTLGKLLFKQWNRVKLEEAAKLYYLRVSLASRLYAVCTGFLYADNKDQVNSALFGEYGQITKANEVIKKFQDNVEKRKDTINKEYFKHAVKDLEDMQLLTFDHKPDEICKPFYDHLTENFPFVEWSVLCAKLDSIRAHDAFDWTPFYNVSIGEPQSSKVWRLLSGWKFRQSFVYVGAQRPTGRNLSTEYTPCKDKMGLYIANNDDNSVIWANRLANKLVYCLQNIDTLVAIQNHEVFEVKWYGHGCNTVWVKEYTLAGMAQKEDKQYYVIANHRDYPIADQTLPEDDTEESVTDEEVVTDELITEEAVTEEAVTEEAVTEEAVTGEAVTEEVVTEEAVTEEAVTEEAVTEEAVTEEAVTEEAVTEEAVTEEAVTEEAVTEEAVTEEAVTDEAVTEEAVTEEAVTEEAVTEEAVTEEAVTEEAVTEEATTEMITAAPISDNGDD